MNQIQPNSNKVNGLLFFLFFLFMAFGGRWASNQNGYSMGKYTSPEIPEIDSESINPILPAYNPYPDKPINGEGRVIIDISHDNNLQDNDLDPLLDRLNARGITVDFFDGHGDLSLKTELRSATGLIVIAPQAVMTKKNAKAFVSLWKMVAGCSWRLTQRVL